MVYLISIKFLKMDQHCFHYCLLSHNNMVKDVALLFVNHVSKLKRKRIKQIEGKKVKPVTFSV